jgi:hypothetical protein
VGIPQDLTPLVLIPALQELSKSQPNLEVDISTSEAADIPWQNGPVTLYTTKWKNNALSEPPIKQWLTQNNLDPVYSIGQCNTL